MRVAVISDVHSNLHALNEVRRAIELEEVDSVVCAGDLVGYGALPNECCRVVEELAGEIVLGNHDLSALSRDTTMMNAYAAEAALWTSEEMDERTRRFLSSMGTERRFMCDDKSVAMFHGSPRDVSEYVYEEEVTEKLLDLAMADIVILGHTHIPYIKSFGDRFVLNPGAVGQPRDGDRRASFAVMDSQTGEGIIRRVEYDIESAAAAIESAGLPSMLAERLFSGL